MNKPSITQSAQPEERYRKNALAISLSTAIVFLIVSAVLAPIAYFENGWEGIWGVALTGGVSLAGFVGAFQISRGHTTRGVAVLIATILALSCALPLLAHGQGLALAIMVLILVASISSASLPPAQARYAIIGAFIIATLIILTDLYLPVSGIPNNPAYTNAVAIIVSVVYALFTMRNFRAYPLRTKIVISFIFITIIPLTVLSFINNRFSTQALQKQSAEQLTSLANIAANKVDEFVVAQLDTVHANAKQLSLIDYVETHLLAREGSQQERDARLTLLTLMRKDSIFIRSIALLNNNGVNILDTDEKRQGQDESRFPYFSRPLKDGLPYVSNIVFRGDTPSIYFSAPVKNRNGRIVGVLRTEYNGVVLQALVRTLDPGTADTIIALVDTNTYLRVGYTGWDRNELFKSYKDFSEMELVAFQSDARLPAGAREDALAQTDQATVDGVDNLQQQPFFNAYSQSLASEATNTGVFLKTQPWAALVRKSTDSYLAPIREQNRTNTQISLLLVVIGVAVGFVVSQVLTSSLTSLIQAAEKITSGDLTARVVVKTEDEIGILADVFNRMTSQLSQTLTGLEQRVAERTTDLELSRQQSEKRAAELQSIGEIAKNVTSEQKLENLLPLITRLVSERFGFYHVGIFLVDSANQFAVLQAANSAGGKNMLRRGHKLEVGGSGIVGYVAQVGKPRISLDVGRDAVYFDNPDLPNTRSEMALPLKVRDNIVGVLDVQSEKPGAFTENDAQTLNILADQIAIALENARLFTQTQQALEEAQTTYRQNIREGWKTFSHTRDFIGYHQGLAGGMKLSQPAETEEIRQSTSRGEVLIFHADGVTQEASIAVPIKLRGQVIGSINIKAPVKNRQWSTDEVNLAETISERLSIALENARLVQESQNRAIKEQKISEVTSRIGASINLKSVLQTAVEELGRAMPGSEVLLQIRGEDGDGNTK